MAARTSRGHFAGPDPWGDMPLVDRPVAQPPRRMRDEWTQAAVEFFALLFGMAAFWVIAWGLAAVMR